LNAPILEEALAASLLTGAGLDATDGRTLAIAPELGSRHVKWAQEQRPCIILRESGGKTILAEAAGRSTPQRTLAGEPVGIVEWEGPDAKVLASGPDVGTGCGEARIKYALLRSAMIVGAAENAFNLALAYSGQREQFGKTIGSFQAVGHSLAIMAGEISLASISLDVALAYAGDESADQLQRDASALVAIVEARNIAGRVARAAHQIHGAIGFTAEHDLHIFTRRLWSWRDDNGNEAYWAGQLARLAQDHGQDTWALLG
jgi:acyl-CoA dehydrogenase